MAETTRAVVLFGSPGSGKGTQARLLTECLHVPHISTGDMLRERIRSGNSVGVAVVATMQAGSLVDDQVVTRLLEQRLEQPDARRGFILDGYPRTRTQAEHLCHWLDQRGMREVVIHLVVDYNIIIARLTGRRQCPRCGALYNVVSRPPRVPGVCDFDGAGLVIRDDDREAVIRERLDAYERQTRPLIEYFGEQGRCLYEIDASDDSPAALFERIRLSIQRRDCGQALKG
jgi:adenylate kinase